MQLPLYMQFIFYFRSMGTHNLEESYTPYTIFWQYLKIPCTRSLSDLLYIVLRFFSHPDNIIHKNNLFWLLHLDMHVSHACKVTVFSYLCAWSISPRPGKQWLSIWFLTSNAHLFRALTQCTVYRNTGYKWCSKCTDINFWMIVLVLLELVDKSSSCKL